MSLANYLIDTLCPLGVLEKVVIGDADMFLLYGLGRMDAPPTDIWIQRAVSKIFFKGKEVTLEESREKLVARYGKWAGLAQLYMFDWIRSISK